jgi:hypothetical protein
MWFGALLCWASLFGASYTTNVSNSVSCRVISCRTIQVINLVLCQGVLYAIGGSMSFHPYSKTISHFGDSFTLQPMPLLYVGMVCCPPRSSEWSHQCWNCNRGIDPSADLTTYPGKVWCLEDA